MAFYYDDDIDLENNEDGFGDEYQDPFEDEYFDGMDESEDVEQEPQNEDKFEFDVQENQKLPPWSPEVLSKTARRYGFSGKAEKFPCPTCGKQSLFLDKKVPTAVRAGTSCFFGFPGNDSIVRYVCLNKKCPSFFPINGVKFSKKTGGGQMNKHKSIFHVIR